MSEWWTYRPSDFLMFSPRIYWRLFESMNAAWWPVQAALPAAALVWLALIWRTRPERAARGAAAAAAGLAGCWLLAAWAFLLERFAPINWPASLYAVVFLVQGLGLVVLAAVGSRGGLVRRAPGRPGARIGAAIGLWALLGHPLLAPLAGRPWTQAEVFGLAPDPTAIATLAYLLLVAPGAARARVLWRGLWLAPLAWCVLSGITLATMGNEVEAAVMLAMPVAASMAARGRPDPLHDGGR